LAVVDLKKNETVTWLGDASKNFSVLFDDPQFCSSGQPSASGREIPFDANGKADCGTIKSGYSVYVKYSVKKNGTECAAADDPGIYIKPQ
jgi:hypothetical protein